MSKNIVEFYDNFVEKQSQIFISQRNQMIQKFSFEFGLKKNHKVLEVGCGIGTQTKLLAEYLKDGEIHSIDISPKSIEMAKKVLSNFNNVTLYDGDFCNMEFNEKDFDFVVLPDVIEHIPIQDHLELFKRIRAAIKPNAIVLIHIPNPNYLEWCIENKPEVLQVIDQPIYTDILVKNVYPNDLYIHHLQTYEIWQKGSDYQLVILKVKSNQKHYEFIPINNTLIGKVKEFIKKLF